MSNKVAHPLGEGSSSPINLNASPTTPLSPKRRKSYQTLPSNKIDLDPIDNTNSRRRNSYSPAPSPREHTDFIFPSSPTSVNDHNPLHFSQKSFSFAAPRVNSFRKSIRNSLHIFKSFKKHKVSKSPEKDKTSIIGAHANDSANLHHVDEIPAPIFHFDEWFTPNTVDGMFDDLLIYTFSFLDYKELIKVGQVSKKWRRLSQMDVLWKREYQRVTFELAQKNENLDRDFRSHFIQLQTQQTMKRKERRYASNKLSKLNIWQSILIYVYAFFAPMTFVCGLLALSVIVPLIFDDRIPASGDGIQYLSIPSIITLFSFLVMALGLYFDPILLSRLKKRYCEYLAQEQLMENPEEMSAYTFNEELDEGWIATFQLLLWSVFWIPLVAICLLAKWALFINISYSVCFIPVYVYYISYLLMPMVISCYKSIFEPRTGNITRDNRWLPRLMHIMANIVNFFMVLQVLLVGLRLDDVTTAPWNVVLLPLWFSFALLWCVCPAYTLCGVLFDDDELSGQVICIGVVLQLLIYPIQAFIIMFALRLDNVFEIPYIYTFIPLYIFESLFICCFCFLSGCCVLCKVFNNFNLLT
jgi:hypothetical protein